MGGFIAGGFVLTLALASPGATCAQVPVPADLRVTLLGTGAPPPDRARMGPSTLVEVGDRRLLFDVGRGASTSVRAHGLRLGDVTTVFLTHLHADHLIGLPDLWLTGHHRDVFGQRPGRLTVFGPPGTAEMLDALSLAFGQVSERWGLDPESIRMVAREFRSEGVLYDQDGLRVTAFQVPHGDEAYGYRVDHGDRSVVISGDTGYSENLIAHAAGTDVLIHEVFFVGEDHGMDPALVERLERSHATPAAAGRVFSQVAPRLAIAVHLGQRASATPGLETAVRAAYPGRFLVGEDLMTIVVGDSVVVIPPGSGPP